MAVAAHAAAFGNRQLFGRQVLFGLGSRFFGWFRGFRIFQFHLLLQPPNKCIYKTAETKPENDESKYNHYMYSSTQKTSPQGGSFDDVKLY